LSRLIILLSSTAGSARDLVCARCFAIVLAFLLSRGRCRKFPHGIYPVQEFFARHKV
jgi:hypothetical protein